MEMTIAQALNKLKLIDKKITKKTRVDFVGVKLGGKIREAFDAVQASADLESVNALITQRSDIKNKINTSNGITEVVIDSKRMTVSEAIAKKDEIAYKEALLSRMKSNFSNATSTIDYNNSEIQERLDVQLQKIDGVSEKEQFSKIFMKSNASEMVDPIGIVAYIKTLDEEVMNFTDEVDYILSTSNATNTITVD